MIAKDGQTHWVEVAGTANFDDEYNGHLTKYSPQSGYTPDNFSERQGRSLQGQRTRQHDRPFCVADYDDAGDGGDGEGGQGGRHGGQDDHRRRAGDQGICRPDWR